MHDYGLTGDGRPFIVMELVEGENLAEALKKQAFQPHTAVALVRQLCSALKVAHQQNIIHRDIKPGNIIIKDRSAGQDNELFAQLLDFGIAKTMNVEEAGGVTRTGEVLGTPAYMSPEQCRGQSLDGRSDIYSLGCVFYEMLTGKPIVTATNTFDYMNWHLNGELPNLFALQNQLPGVDKVLRRMLAKLPDERYQDMAALDADLARLLEGKPIKPSAKTPSGTERKRLASLGLSGVLMLMAIGHLMRQPSEPLPIPPEPKPVVKQEVTYPSGVTISEPVDESRRVPFSVKELQRQLKLIRLAATESRAAGNNAKADSLEMQAQAAENVFNRKTPLPAGTDPKLVEIGVYEGDKSRTLTEFGIVEPKITYTAHPVVLSLSSYSPVIWKLDLAPGVKIARIILQTYEAGSYVENPPAGVKVEKRLEPGYSAYEFSEKSQSKHDPEVFKMTGISRIALVGNYGGSAPIEVGSGSDDFMAQQALQVLQPTMKEAAEVNEKTIDPLLRSLDFWGIAREKEAPEPAQICRFNGYGPIPGSAVKGMHTDLIGMVHVPEEGAIYGITDHDFYRMPLKKEPKDPFVLKNKIAMHWLSGVTYDSKRKSVILSCDGNNGPMILSLDPRTRTWSVLHTFARESQEKYSSMYYDKTRDRIFALSDALRSAESRSIFVLRPDGSLERTIKLDTAIKSGDSHAAPQMVIKDNYAVMVVPVVPDHDSGTSPISPKIAVFDLTTGKLLHMGPWKTSVQPKSIFEHPDESESPSDLPPFEG